MISDALSVVILGGSGAVGTQVLQTLLKNKSLKQVTILGRSPILNIDVDFVHQYKIDIHDANSYVYYLRGHNTAICTLGVGQPSKMNNDPIYPIRPTKM
jgi:saccharopine dehydrogenase-like NADP-dependent oxidoreductase